MRRQRREVRGSRVPRSENARPDSGGNRGFPGSTRPRAFPCSPRPRFQRRLPERPRRGPGALREGCGAPMRPRGICALPLRSPVAGRAEAENHTSALSPQMPRVPSPPPPPFCPGQDRPVGLAHLNLDLPGGTGAASSERALSSARATAGRGERARRELQQVSLGDPSVPCPGTAVICAPHSTQLSSSPPSRPALRRRLRGGALNFYPAP